MHSRNMAIYLVEGLKFAASEMWTFAEELHSFSPKEENEKTKRWMNDIKYNVYGH